ncbi:Gfo/Idh/MocA family protein [Rhodococcoides fascians]|uniref:Gfo/Idh/MocA family protein n=1 Tax=Rhodococcoides fascians TaxID=1828 RepID=UPI00056398AE|nr:Gfo/Idh/MocA family oxidoreductase [Rhodococcus fascians]
MGKLRVAVVGLGFGAEFVPIYQSHPEAELAGICDPRADQLDSVGERWGVPEGQRFSTFEAVLESGDVDAVHILTPPRAHAAMTLAAFDAGKHVACTVPMAVTEDECRRITIRARETGLTYMMMETAVYTREFLFVRDLLDRGELGRIQFLRGSHQQDMTVGWPEYWWGFPPMHYATHAVGPLFALAGSTPESVVCFGSGRIREEYIPRYGSPFAVESALFSMRDSDIAAEATRSLYETVRQYKESFDVYGMNGSFEWEQTIGDHPVLFTGGEDATRVEVPDFAHLLPPDIAGFTRHGALEQTEHLSVLQGSGHGGSHPHLVHEFVSAIVEGRRAAVDAPTAAAWTMAGLAAHESAMNNGARITISDFTAI